MVRQILVWQVLLGLVVLGSVLPGQEPGTLGEAHRAAGVLIMERLKAEDAAGYDRIRRCPRSHILLVDGVHDHTDRVLRSLGLRFDTCSASGLARRSLRSVRLLIIDCPGGIGPAATDRVRRFVEAGGTLLTTDWSVLVLERAFPGRVCYTGNPTRDDVVRISWVNDHPLMHRVFPPGRFAAWWLENRSYPVRLIRGATSLMQSDEMRERYGSPVLGLTFPHGRGQVVHVVSHTYLQRNHYGPAWERRTALDEARSLRLPVGSPGYAQLRRDGTLGRLRAGDLNAALSIQQFLLNVVRASLGGRRPVPPRPPVVTPHPPRPPRPPIPPRPAPARPRGDALRASAATWLHDAPGGNRVLRVAEGLRLFRIGSRGDWIEVHTPAGQTGWISASKAGGM